MSYIEKKYLAKIKEIFDQLTQNDKNLLELIQYRSFTKVDDIAKELADLNKKINLILKNYYPEIKNLEDKLEIKSIMKFYYDFLHNLTDFIRNVENFKKIDDRYYDALIDFIESKDILINNKYKSIVSKELTSFYDKKSRAQLERVLASKLQLRERNFFTFGPLEEEIKKIGRIHGASKISIIQIKEENQPNYDLKDATTLIKCEIEENHDQNTMDIITNKIKIYLESKQYAAIINSNILITDARLMPD